MVKLVCATALLAIGNAAASLIPAVFPKVTTSADNDLGTSGWSPAPTNALLHQPNPLEKRQGVADTCGYISGNALQPLTCAAGYICVINSSLKAAGCCVNLSCTLNTACVPQTAVQTGLVYNSRVLLCTAGLLTQCATKAYNYGTAYLSEYDCASFSTVIIVSTTSTVVTPLVTTSRITVPTTTINSVTTIVSPGTTIVNAGSTGVSPGTTLVKTALDTTSAPIVVHTQVVTDIDSKSTPGTATSPLSTGTTVIDLPTPTGTTAASASNSKAAPVGAIAGGVVGGLVVIGAAVVGIVFLFLRSKRRHDNVPPPAVGDMSNVDGTAGLGPGPGGQAYYAPAAAAAGYCQHPAGFQQQAPAGYNQQAPAAAALVPHQDANKGFSEANTHSFSPPLSPAPPYPPSPYGSSPVHNAVEIDQGRPGGHHELP